MSEVVKKELLTEMERRSLLSISVGDGFAALDKLMREKIKRQIAEHLALEVGDEKKIAASHAAIQSLTNFYAELMEEVQFQAEMHVENVREAVREREAKALSAGKMTPEQYQKFL